MTFAPETKKEQSTAQQQPVFYTVKRRDSCDDATLNKLDPYLFELLDMLTIRRRDKTQTELSFCDEYMKGITKNDGKFVKFNILKDPTNGEVLAYYYKATNDPVLWSSHVDSVHNGAGKVKVAFDPFMMAAYVEDASTPLGADDAAGMWLLFQMIRAGIGGTYIFHKAEEVGGVGSRGVAKYHQGFLSNYDYAIAFDRKANTSVITHQGGSRCCSDVFAESIIGLLNKQPNMAYKKDDGGVFTDTKNYIDYIAECTNLSCGYMHEHTTAETLDVEFLISLKNALIASFIGGFSYLKKSRKAGDKESKWGGSYGGYTSSYRGKQTGKGYDHNSAVAYPNWGSKRQNDSKGSCSKQSGNRVPDWYSSGLAGLEDDDLMYESRKQYYTPEVMNRGADKSKKDNPLDRLLDKAEMEVIYFNMHDMSAIEMETHEAEILESKEYQDYDDSIIAEIVKLSRMDKEGLRKALIRLDVGKLTSLVKKLIVESGY